MNCFLKTALCCVAFTLRLTAASGQLGAPYDNTSPKFQSEIEAADLIRVRAGGVPKPTAAQARIMLEIEGAEAVKDFLAPLQLFTSSKRHAAPCDCNGDPTIEIYRGGKLITSIAVQHSAALGWPDRWPDLMLVENRDAFKNLNARLAASGFPQYAKAHDEMMQLAARVIQNQQAAKSGDSPVRRLMKEVTFDTTGWQLVVEEPTKITWQDEANDTMVLILAPRRPNQTDPRNLERSRDELRTALKSGRAGIVEVEPVKIGSVFAQWMVMKEPQAQSGYFYQTGVIISTTQSEIVLNIASNERGTTGMREATFVAIAAVKSGNQPGSLESASAHRDPYDKRFDQGAVYAPSDERRFDASLPDHPLSRTRRKMQRIVDSLALSNEILKVASFRDRGQ